MDRSVKRDIKKRYERMLKDQTEGNRDKVNCYTCEDCGKVTKTIDRDNGITPMGIECPFCKGNAMSSFYNDIAPNIPTTYEWYRPTLEEVYGMVDRQFFTVNHILDGGLIRREIR